MARLFILKFLLEEAHRLDISEMRRQAVRIRKLSVLSGDDDYISVYRLSEELIQQLEIDLNPLLKTTKRRGKGLSTRIKILCALSFLANGSYQKVVKENIRTYLSQPSVSRCIREVVEALNHPEIVKKYIRFPQNAEERRVLKERFHEKFQIPGVVGCIDGTFVAMKRPSEHEERYYCRGYHGRNVQLITDADLNILHVDPTYGGATHDSFIFNYSILKDYLEGLTNAGEEVVLLGDSGYAQHAFLMTPVSNAQENTPEEFYNQMHCTAHNSVKRTIGVLKGRFRCLLVHRVLEYHPDIVAKVVIACCVLHNLCNRAGIPAPPLTENEEEEEARFIEMVHSGQTRDAPSRADLTEGQLRRQELISSLWRERNV